MASEPIQGLSYFSTEGYQRPPRAAGHPPPPPILRTDVERDTATFISNLRKKHPIICYGIFPGWDIRHFFDEYDYHQQGGEFLYNVILQIMKENEVYCVEYCHKWSEAHRQSLHQLLEIDDAQKLFHANDRMKWGARFLEKAYECMKRAYVAAVEEEKSKDKSAAKRQISGGSSTSAGASSTTEVRRRASSNAVRRPRSLSRGFPISPRPNPMALVQPFPYGHHGNPQEAVGFVPEIVHEHPGLPIPSSYVLHQRGLEIMQVTSDRQNRGEIHNEHAAPLEPPGVMRMTSAADPGFNENAGPNVHHVSHLSLDSIARIPPPIEPFRHYNPSARSRGRSGGYGSQGYVNARRASFSRPYSRYDENTSQPPVKPGPYWKNHANAMRRSISVSSGAYNSRPVASNTSHSVGTTEPECIQRRDRSISNETHHHVLHHEYQPSGPSFNADPASPFFVAENYIGPGVTEAPILFVGGFGHDDSHALRSIFEPRFPVDSINIRLPNPGEDKKAYAFVKLTTVRNTRDALDVQLYNASGRKLVVQVAKKCCSQPQLKPRFDSYTPGDSGERTLDMRKDHGGEISEQNSSLPAPRGHKVPGHPPAFTPQDARSSLPRDHSSTQPSVGPADSPPAKKPTPPKRKASGKAKQATKAVATTEGDDVTKQTSEGTGPLNIGNDGTPAQEALKPTWANVASKPSLQPRAETPSEATRKRHVEPVQAGRYQDQQPAEKSERPLKSLAERSPKAAKTQSDPKASVEKGRLAPSKQTVKEERLSPINEDADETGSVNESATFIRSAHDQGNTDGTAAVRPASPPLTPVKSRRLPGKGHANRATTFKSPAPTPSSLPALQGLNKSADGGSPKPDSVASSSTTDQADPTSLTEQPGTAPRTASPGSGKSSKQLGFQMLDEESKAQTGFPTEDKAFARMHEGIGNLISGFPQEEQAYWQSRVDVIKSNIDSEEAKLCAEGARYQSASTSTQKKTIKKRMTKTKERCQDGIDRLFMLHSEMSNELQKFADIKEGNIKASTGSVTNIFKTDDRRSSGYDIPIFVLTGGESSRESAGRTLDEIIAHSRPKEASVGGSYALKGSAMAFATEDFGCGPAVPLVRQNSITSQASAGSRLSYATVAASQSTTNTAGVVTTPEGTVSNESTTPAGEETPTGPAHGKQREVSWGVGPEGEWGEKGLRGQCL